MEKWQRHQAETVDWLIVLEGSWHTCCVSLFSISTLSFQGVLAVLHLNLLCSFMLPDADVTVETPQQAAQATVLTSF